jgi:hypothetical protein
MNRFWQSNASSVVMQIALVGASIAWTVLSLRWIPL